MEKYIIMTLPDRVEKSYIRQDSCTDTIFTFWTYKAAGMTFAKRAGTTTRLVDKLALQMLADGLITEDQLAAYTERVCTEYFHKDCHADQSPEDIYAFLCRTRKGFFGIPALEQAKENEKCRGCTFTPKLDQRAKKQALLKEKQAVIFALCEPALFAQLQEDLQAACRAEKAVYLCVSPDGGGDLPSRQQLSRWLGDMENIRYLETDEKGIAWDAELQDFVDKNGACLFFYGEEGLLHCRKLRTDAVVSAIPKGYHAQALCNQLGSTEGCTVYIPAGLDITPYVPLTEQTRLTYNHLYRLSRDHGDGIYRMTPEALYARYPGYFLNIYENENLTFPITAGGDDFRQFDESKDEAIYRFLNDFDNISYTCRYFDEELKEQPVVYDSTQKQPGILVHSIRVKKAKESNILSCKKGITPRETIKSLHFPETGLVSNFLFFLTPKLGVLYNNLRADRPMEQADAAAGHLDYMLSYKDGIRTETFPLFQKTCIAKTAEGEFFFFRFRLGGGSVRISDVSLRWEKDAVDTACGDVCVFTPFYSAMDEDADRETYRTLVGTDRVNLVILQDKVTCIRRGDVVLPSVGVVISLSETAAAPLLAGLRPLENGYYDVSGLRLSVQLDPPEGVDPRKWEQTRWAYGGGMTLIQNGTGMCDGADTLEWFRRDGWLTPLSRQTQESALHKMVKHPRTAIGTGKNGDLVILVCSGRTWRSTGADYREMIEIARSLYPDIQNLMNVDGGGSAMLGMTHNGSFMELSYPATSSGSCAGMVRPINTLFYIPAEKEKRI